MKSFVIALLFVLLSSVAFADPPPLNTPVPDAGYPNPSTTGVTLFTGLNAQADGAYPQGSFFHCGGMSTVRFKVSGTFTGTLTFYYSMDGGSSWDLAHCYTDGGSTAVTSTTAPGYWYFPCAGANLFGVGFSSYGTGSANAFARGTMVSVKPPSGGGGAGSWIGAILRSTSDQATAGAGWTDLAWNQTDVDTASGFSDPYYTFQSTGYYDVSVQVQNKSGGGKAARIELVLADGTVVGADQQPGAPVTIGTAIPNLAGYYALNETSGNVIYDTSGNGLNGTQVTASQFAAGTNGQATCRNTDNNAYLNLSTNFNTSTTGWTYDFWINVFDNQGVYANLFYNAGGGGVWNAYWRNSNVIRTQPNYTDYDSSSPLPMNTWLNIVLIFDHPDSASFLYSNGMQLIAGNCGAQPTGGITTICGGGNQWWLGAYIQDLQVYNRALTATEITNLYTLPHSPDGAGNMIVAASAAPPNGRTLTAHCTRHFTAGDQIKARYWNDGPGDTIQTLSTYSPVFTIHKQ